jgi:hypothetical protein
MESSWNQEMKHTKATLSDRQDTVRGAVFTVHSIQKPAADVSTQRGDEQVLLHSCAPNVSNMGYYRENMSRLYWYHTKFIHSLSPFGIILSCALIHISFIQEYLSIYPGIFTVSLIYIVFDLHIFHILVNFTRHQDESKRKSAALELTTAQVLGSSTGPFFLRKRTVQ